MFKVYIPENVSFIKAYIFDKVIAMILNKQPITVKNLCFAWPYFREATTLNNYYYYET